MTVTGDPINFSNPTSIANNQEYGGYIYSKDGQYYASQPQWGNGQHVTQSIPRTAVGDYHGHGDYSKTDATGQSIHTNKAQDQFDSDHFSVGTNADTGNSETLRNYTGNGAYRSYLGTPSGQSKEYDPVLKVEKPLIVIPPPPPPVIPETETPSDAFLAMTNLTLRMPSEYGIMFLYDTNNKPEFPTNAGELGITFTDSCVAFSVLVYVDGDAEVVIADSTNGLRLEQTVFTGRIKCESRSLSLFDTNGFAYASVPLESDYAHVRIRMSEDKNPDLVECVVENMMTF